MATENREKYRVCLIMPEGNPHAACFREIGLLLISALKSNGIDCDFTVNTPAPERINIILGYHLLTFHEDLKNLRYIPYQLEQLHSQEFPFTPNMELILRHATEVWDYSEKNITFLTERGIPAKHLVPGFHPNLQLVPQDVRRGTDILFYGSIGERRNKILSELSSLLKVKTLFGVYGEKRDKWICRSNIILNVHHYSQQIFEAVRISYLLNNACFVVSETSVNYCYPEVDMVMVPYEELTATCIQYLKNLDQMENRRQENFHAFKKKYPMTKLIREVL